ncbi:MAG: hypothetical protein WBL50_10255 [Candidatus Acidiferrum sp.]
MTGKQYWKICCQEKEVAGLWQRWFKNQCVAVGWRIRPGLAMEGPTKSRGWARARNVMIQIKPGDMIVVQLKDNRVGRVGEVVRSEFDKWNPLVSPNKKHPEGRYGRRIAVRWDLNVGPTDVGTVVGLPKGSQLPANVARPTICAIDPKLYESVVEAMKNENNWLGLQGRFKFETSLSDYIANFPHTLEDDLLPYPDVKVREKVFPNKSRSDVLLIDGRDFPVVVECKQGSPTIKDINQLRGYMKRFQELTGRKTRGILVHGGAGTLKDEVRQKMKHYPAIKFVQYSLQVGFASSK